MKEAIVFEDYESISDLLLYINPGCVLKMTVNLGGRSKNNERIPAIREYQYRTNKYIDKDKMISVKRKFYAYLSIEYKDDSEILGKGIVKITHYDILGFRDRVMEVDKKLDQCFALKKGSLILIAENKFEVRSMPSDNVVIFTPTIIIYPDKTKSPGVKMIINNHVYIDMAIKTWKAFVYYIQTADLYGWAASIVSGYTESTIGKDTQDLSTLSKDPTLGDEFSSDIGFKNTKPLSKEEKRKRFFDN